MLIPKSAAEVIDAETKVILERTRLEREVINAAKKWRHDKTFKSDSDLFNTVCNLESFEFKQERTK